MWTDFRNSFTFAFKYELGKNGTESTNPRTDIYKPLVVVVLAASIFGLIFLVYVFGFCSFIWFYLCRCKPLIICICVSGYVIDSLICRL